MTHPIPIMTDQFTSSSSLKLLTFSPRTAHRNHSPSFLFQKTDDKVVPSARSKLALRKALVRHLSFKGFRTKHGYASSGLAEG